MTVPLVAESNAFKVARVLVHLCRVAWIAATGIRCHTLAILARLLTHWLALRHTPVYVAIAFEALAIVWPTAFSVDARLAAHRPAAIRLTGIRHLISGVTLTFVGR